MDCNALLLQGQKHKRIGDTKFHGLLGRVADEDASTL
jgi:hypothetical protein